MCAHYKQYTALILHTFNKNIRVTTCTPIINENVENVACCVTRELSGHTGRHNSENSPLFLAQGAPYIALFEKNKNEKTLIKKPRVAKYALY